MADIIAKFITGKDVTADFVEGLKVAFPADQENPEWDLKKTQAFAGNTSNIMIVGYLGGELAGFLYGYILDRPDNQKQFLIYEVSTSKKFRRKGVMKEIFNTLFDYLKNNDFDEAWVLTNKSNIAATSLYKTMDGRQENADDVMYTFKLSEYVGPALIML